MGMPVERYLRATYWVSGLFMLFAAPASANLDIQQVLIRAEGNIEITGRAALVAEDFPGAGAASAKAALDLPVFTPPGGGPYDTLFQPASVHAFQSNAGFNATSVQGAFANGLERNFLYARTLWSIEVFVNLSVLPGTGPSGTDVTLDYLLFPGEVGLSTFGTGNAGFRTRIGVFGGSEVRAELTMTREIGKPLPVITASGDFATLPVTLGAETRDGLNYHVAKTEAIVGSAALGRFLNGSTFFLEYEMEAWLEVPGFEVAGFARISDPFELENDPTAFIGSQFPGLENFQFSVREVPAPVPLPGAWVMLASGLAFLGVCHRRGGALRARSQGGER
jgi:hypothetical protein